MWLCTLVPLGADKVSESKLNFIGVRIRDVRKSKKIRQVDLAERVGVTHQSICLIERGKKRPRLQLLVAICDALETNPNHVLGY